MRVPILLMKFSRRFCQKPRRRLALQIGLAGAGLAIALLASGPGNGASRIKDIADFEGIRDNMLIGYGLVVGLNGSGDSLRNAPFTKQSLESMLERLALGAWPGLLCRSRSQCRDP